MAAGRKWWSGSFVTAAVLSAAPPVTAFVHVAPRAARAWTLEGKVASTAFATTTDSQRPHSPCWGVPTIRAPMPASSSPSSSILARHAQSPSASVMDSQLKEERAQDFAKHCSKEKRLSLDGLLATDEIRDLIKDGLVSEDEVQDVWIQVVGPSLKASVDFEGFLKVHDAIDTLFEEVEEVEEGEPMRVEFNKLCRGGQKVSLDAFMELPEIQEFLEEGALSGPEVQELYERVVKPGEMGLDYEAFVKLYRMVDDLFEEDEEEEAATPSSTAKPSSSSPAASPRKPPPAQQAKSPPSGPPPMSPGAYFARFSSGGEMSLEAVAKAPSIKDLLDEGSLAMDELKEIYAEVSKGTPTVDFRGFQLVLDKVDDLFEDEEEEEEQQQLRPPTPPSPPPRAPPQASTTTGSGIPTPEEFTASLNPLAQDKEVERVDPTLAKGVLKELVASSNLVKQLEVEEDPDPAVLALIDSLSKAPGNLANDMDLALEDVEDVLVGEWELVYTTSRSMKYNSGLTGLCNTLPQAELLGVSQTISLDDFDSYDVYTTERLLTLGNNFDAIIDGTWELLSTYSIMTEEPVLTVNIEPIRIKYGALTDSMETGWKGARVLNRCEVVYLDESIRVMKGNSNDCFFVWYRKEES